MRPPYHWHISWECMTRNEVLGRPHQRKLLSWCGTTSPPIFGCLQMYMLCTGSGRSNSSDLNSACIFFDLRAH